MSDKSFGDHTTRNIVKNPLLSTAVTGLSLEDLTHKAVLLPVTPSLGQITRPDQQQGPQSRTLGHADLETPTLPSGDAFSNVTLSNIDQSTNQNIINSQNNVKLENNRGNTTATKSKASLKSEDDFDVNEYIARLQGSKYVSAPLHSHLKEDQKNLEATEESLEEINLNDSQGPVEVQQSLTADIAQNFSQLPTVLPHVASAVFSSFSNMLNYKGREQTPDTNVVPEPVNKGYDDVQFQRADVGVAMGMEEYTAPKEVVPPPKEPPGGGSASNYRITTRKKYAQIPGLSSGDPAQTMTFNVQTSNISTGQNMPPIGQNMPPTGYIMPPIGQNMPPTGHIMPPTGYNMPPTAHNIPPTGHNMPPTGQDMTAAGQNMLPSGHMPLLCQNMPPTVQSIPPAFIGNTSGIGQNISHFFPSTVTDQNLSMGSSIPKIFNPYEVKRDDGEISKETLEKTQETFISTQNIAQSQYNVFNPNVAESQAIASAVASATQPHVPTNQTSQNFFYPVEQKEQTQNIPNAPAAVIPPPPMFSNLPRKDSPSLVGKSILPPSVARRIAGNQPLMKPGSTTPTFNENIFVPAPVSETRESLDQAVASTGAASAFVPTYPALSKSHPLQSGTPLLQQNVPSMPPSISQAAFFVPSKEEKSQISQAPPAYFIPSKNPHTSSETPTATLLTPKEEPSQDSTSKADSFISSSISTLPPGNVNAFGLTTAPSNERPTNEPVPLFFTPGPPNFGTSTLPGPSALNPETNINWQTHGSIPSSNIPPLPQSNHPTSFFNPLDHGHTTIENLHSITQPTSLPHEPPKPVAEPPKAAGNVNFRMAKKRPQYYAGPIEGVGAISNNVIPVITPIIPVTNEASNFQGALLTPEQPIQSVADQAAPNLCQASVPFDINRPAENVATVFDISKPQEQYRINQLSGAQDYNTAFDMSRATTEMYDSPKQESKSFGIIGSLKSKLSSLDINKIQSTVTTFFDPAYNDTKVGESGPQDNAPYGQQGFSQQPQQQQTQAQSSFDIYVPNVEYNQYGQYQHSYDYNTSQYYQQDHYPQGQHLYSMSNYQTSDYSSEQTNPANQSYASPQEQTPASGYTHENIPRNIETLCTENTVFYNPNAFTQNVNSPVIEQQPPVNIASVNKDNKNDPIASISGKDSNISKHNPNAYMKETHKVPIITKQALDAVSFSEITPEQLKHPDSTVLSEKIQEPTFYNPNTFASENQQTPKALESAENRNDMRNTTQLNIGSNIHEPRNDAQTDSTYDSALNTSKYNFSNIQTPPAQQNLSSSASFIPASSFFDMPGNISQMHSSTLTDLDLKTEQDLVKDNMTNTQQHFGFVDFNKTTATTMSPIGTKSKKNVGSDDGKDQLLKENTLIESLSKEEIPILGVSTVPLFGLSTMTTDNTREISALDDQMKNVSIFSAETPKYLNQDSNASFEKNNSVDQLIHENRTKEVNITGLDITAVKNVLLMEPPQENIGAVLKRNASSSKLENNQKPEDDTQNKSMFYHDSQGVIDKEHKHVRTEGHSEELDICETCREVNTPDILPKEDVTALMIENITSRMALSNPVTVPFTESDEPIDGRPQFENRQQLDEITRIAEDTMTTLLVQSATALLDDQITSSEVRPGFTTEDAAYLASQVDNDCSFQIEANSVDLADHDYNFKLDPNAIGFFGNNSLFFDNLPTNASDEIKAEIRNSHEDVVVPQQMSIPSAPLAEDDTKSDETGGLDVHLIEQDAKKDFPLEEEFVIEPSETDDDKIEFRERKKSSEDSTINDTFTNRVERFKKTVDNSNDEASEQTAPQVFGSQPMSMASYFDTGNYAVESHYRNSLTSPTSVNTFMFSGNVMRIPPGFEEEYARRLSGMSLGSGENRNEYIPDPASQAQLTSTTQLSYPQDTKENVIGFEMRKKENSQAYAESTEKKTESGNPANWLQQGPTNHPTDVYDQTQVLPRFNDPFIPPQFEEDQQNVKSVPNTSTQTHMAYSTSYSSPVGTNENIDLEMHRREIEAHAQAIGENPEIVHYATDAKIFKGFCDHSTITGQLEQDFENVKQIPDITTPTRLLSTTLRNRDKEDNAIGCEISRKESVEAPVRAFSGTLDVQQMQNPADITHYAQPFAGFTGTHTFTEQEDPQYVKFVPNTSTQTKLAGSTTFSNPQQEPLIISDSVQKFTGFASPQISDDQQNVKFIPNTSTQTSIAFSTTYKSPDNAKENVVIKANPATVIKQEEDPQKVKTVPNTSTQTRFGFSTTYSSPQDVAMSISGQTNQTHNVDSVETFTAFAEPTAARQAEINPLNVQSLPDPMNFFSANVQETKPEEETQSFNRLAMYFTTPPAQPEHSKSFFELSQSQNHYRHDTKTFNIEKSFFDQPQNIDDNTKANIKKLMKDLTSPNNLQENIVRTVNYFTVEYENNTQRDINPINVKLNENIPKVGLDKVDTTKLVENNNENVAEVGVNKVDRTNLVNKSKYRDVIFNCGYCLNNFPGFLKDYNVRTAMNDTSQPRPSETSDIMPDKANHSSRTTTVNFGNADVEGQTQDGVFIVNENRMTSEYIPVKHHWFYRVDVEEKSVWRGFSLVDSRALEDAFRSLDLNENTLVATDGGRYDVNVMGRLRTAVYWKEKPTNVRRCSWFYKGTTDARYVPYTEAVAEKLEEEYRHGITTGEWHRKLSLPNGEMVIMHGPSVMVHFLQSGATDVFSTPPNVLGKRVYRNPPKIRVARDQPAKVDHLILLVHGAGEYKRYPYLEQTTSRPRVVRRGHEESEIEDPEPSKIDHLLLLCHGVGSACDMRFRSVEEVVEDFRTTSLQLIQSHYRNSYDNGIVNRVEVLPISWHAQLHSGETGVDRRLSRVTLDSIPRLRAFTNHTVLDVLFYTSPVFHQTIIDTVCSELNRIYSMFKQRNPDFEGNVSLGGHSLGSVILYDLLCHQKPETPLDNATYPGKTYVAGTSGSFQSSVKYPQLLFSPAALYALGSPIAIFECIRGVDLLGMDFSLPTCKHFFNIFHPYDPIAYRIEPLINPLLQEIKPSQIPHHKGRKRMHLELKDTMQRVGADLKQKLMESLRTTWNKWKAGSPTDGQLEKVVEEEIEKEQLCETTKEDGSEMASPEMLGNLNSGRRIDYVLQEAPLEMINEYLFAMSSHVGYWESEDTMLLMLREIYTAMGVQADCTVPQQSMTVQRTTVPQNEATFINEKEYPSTSRGGT